MRVLLLGERADALVALLRARGIEAVAAEAPERQALAAAGVVVFAGEPGTPLPGAAWDVLSAGRLLVVPRAEPAYGLQPGIDHLSAGSDQELVELAEMAVTFPAAFEPVVAIGRMMAQARSASA